MTFCLLVSYLIQQDDQQKGNITCATVDQLDICSLATSSPYIYLSNYPRSKPRPVDVDIAGPTLHSLPTSFGAAARIEAHISIRNARMNGIHSGSGKSQISWNGNLNSSRFSITSHENQRSMNSSGQASCPRILRSRSVSRHCKPRYPYRINRW